MHQIVDAAMSMGCEGLHRHRAHPKHRFVRSRDVELLPTLAELLPQLAQFSLIGAHFHTGIEAAEKGQ